MARFALRRRALITLATHWLGVHFASLAVFAIRCGYGAHATAACHFVARAVIAVVSRFIIIIYR